VTVLQSVIFLVIGQVSVLVEQLVPLLLKLTDPRPILLIQPVGDPGSHGWRRKSQALNIVIGKRSIGWGMQVFTRTPQALEKATQPLQSRQSRSKNTALFRKFIEAIVRLLVELFINLTPVVQIPVDSCTRCDME
jgi:hypothetical protein